MWKTFLMSCIMMLSVSGVALAHFGMVIPSAGTVTDKKDADVTLDLSFTHPMEMQGMPLAKPKAVQVIANGKTEDLKPSLKAKKIVDHDGWTAQYAIKRPGVYQFVMEPQPYWEPAEDCYIVHYTKAYVAAFGDEEGWDEPAGLKTEIVPLTRPFGNYAGNVFQGQVLLNGKDIWAEPKKIRAVRFQVGMVFQYPEYQLFEESSCTTRTRSTKRPTSIW